MIAHRLWQPMVVVRLAPPGGTLFTLRLQNLRSLQSQNGNGSCACNLRLLIRILCVDCAVFIWEGKGD